MAQDNFVRAAIKRFFARRDLRRVKLFTRWVGQNQTEEPKLLDWLEKKNSPALWATAYWGAENETPFKAQLALGRVCAHDTVGTDPTSIYFRGAVQAATATIEKHPDKETAKTTLLALLEKKQSLALWDEACCWAENETPFKAQLALSRVCAHDTAGTDPTGIDFRGAVQVATATIEKHPDKETAKTTFLDLLKKKQSLALWDAVCCWAKNKTPFKAQLALGRVCAHDTVGTDPTDRRFLEAVQTAAKNMEDDSVHQENAGKWQAFSAMLLKKGNEPLLFCAAEAAGEKAPEKWRRAIAILELRATAQEIGQGVVQLVRLVPKCMPSVSKRSKSSPKTLDA